MREIKFRAWMSPDKYMLSHDELMKIPVIYHDVFEGNSKYPCMQYTGIKDKNGIEIYEGDILLEENKGAIRAINKPRQNSIVVFKDDGWKRDTYNGSLNVFPPINVRGMEIIGNIYENPELLK